MSTVGSIENLSQTIISIETGIDNWLAGYSGGAYENIIKDEETSDAMQGFLVTFTFDMIAYAFTSVLHSLIIIFAGYGGCYWIMN